MAHEDFGGLVNDGAFGLNLKFVLESEDLKRIYKGFTFKNFFFSHFGYLSRANQL
jgi:hypothetical protein